MPKIGTVDHFVDRGDPAAYDFTTSSLTKNSQWQDLDLSAIVPAGAKAVIIKAYLIPNVAGRYFSMRAKGNANAINTAEGLTASATYPVAYQWIIKLNAGRVVQYISNFASAHEINICVMAWFV